MLLDGMIDAGRFFDFVIELLEIDMDKTLWEFYLHKVYEGSFEDFKRTITPQAQPTVEDLGATVCNSKSILSSFKPNGTGGE